MSNAGLAGVEENRGASSDYRISNQISGFLEVQEVLRLVVKPAAGSKNGCFPQKGFTCVDHKGFFVRQLFEVLKDFSINLEDETYFINGERVGRRRILMLEDQVYCRVFVARDGMSADHKKLLPKELVKNNRTALVPANLSPYRVTDMSWYDSSVFVGTYTDNDERFGLGFVCGKVKQGQLVDSRATSLDEFLQAFKGIIKLK